MSEFLGRVVYAVTGTLQGGSDDAKKIVYERTPENVKITCDGDEIAWFMDFAKTAVTQTVDAAVHCLKTCEKANTYTLEVLR